MSMEEGCVADMLVHEKESLTRMKGSLTRMEGVSDRDGGNAGSA